MSEKRLKGKKSERSKIEEKYKFEGLLGKGQFGKVFKGKCHKEDQEYAIKIIPISKIQQNPKLKKLVSNEIEVLDILSHPNIIQFHQLFYDANNIYMVYELCDESNLQELLPLPLSDLISIFRQILNACAFAEKNKTLHRDLKPANILFKNGLVKVADWGFSRQLKVHQITQSFIGSPAYMAPEVLRGEQYSSKADVWSFGVMLYECIHGKMPWQASNIQNLQLQQQKNELKIKSNIPKMLKKLLLKSLIFNPSKRCTFVQLQQELKKQQIKQSNLKEQQNPQIQPSSCQQSFNEEDIKQCSLYLQFAKDVNKKIQNPINALSLELIFVRLLKLKKNKFPIQNQCEPNFTYTLLSKEIQLIRKLIQNNSEMTGFSENKLCNVICKGLEKELKKQILASWTVMSARERDKTRLIWICTILDIILSQFMPQRNQYTNLSAQKQHLQSLTWLKLLQRVQYLLQMGLSKKH